VGNAALKPELSRQTELYYATDETAVWRMRLTLFHARYRDLIDFDAGPPPKLVNRASIHSTGLEFNLRRNWHPGLSTYAQGTVMEVRDPDGGPPLRFRPRQQVSLGIEAQPASQWRLHADIGYIGRRFDSSIPTGDVWLGSYAQANLSLTWLGSGWRTFAAMDNVLNRNADEAIGTPIPKRRLQIGLEWAL
jgi:iron complex outermembrane receptor protein/vitamin B12 transporter